MKILCSADWHANSNYKSFIDSYNQILDYIKKEEVSLVILSGDVFDSRMFADNNYTEIINNIKTIGDCCNVIINYGTPSHDFNGCYAPFEKNIIKTKYPIKIINNSYPQIPIYFLKENVLYETDIDNFNDGDYDLIITGLPWVSKSRWLINDELRNLSVEEQNVLYKERTDDYFKTIKKLNKIVKAPTIWMGHLQLENITASYGQDVSADSHPSYWIKDLADVVVLGHIHKKDEYYCGSIYNKTWGELEEKYFKVIHINDNKITNIDEILINTPKLIKIECSYDEYKKIKKEQSVEDVPLKDAKVWFKIILPNKKILDANEEKTFWKEICDARIDFEKVPTVAIQRLEEYDKSTNLVNKFELWCEQKGYKVTNFQIDKLKQLDNEN